MNKLRLREVKYLIQGTQIPPSCAFPDGTPTLALFITALSGPVISVPQLAHGSPQLSLAMSEM